MAIKESRTKLFTYNILVFGLAMVVSKLVTFILAPIHSRFFSTELYGFYDLTNTFIGILGPIAMLGTADSLFRYYFEQDDLDYRSELISTGIKLVTYTTLVASLIAVLANKWIAQIFFGVSGYESFIILGSIIVFLANLTTLTQSILRMENNRKKILQVTVIQAGTTLLLNIIFIMVLKLGIEFVLVASLINFLIILLITYRYGRKYIRLSNLSLNKKITIEILKYGLPLTPVFIGYWVLAATDRLFLNTLYGASVVGLYAIGTKVANIMNLFQTIFGTGWQHFSFSIMKDKDAAYIFGKLFDLFVLICSVSITVLLFYSDFLFRILFNKEYYHAWLVAPILCFGPFLMILRWIGGVGISINKKTHISTLSMLLAVFMNVGFNVLLIPKYSLMGAAIATLISYISMLVFTIIGANRYFKVELDLKRIGITALLLVASFMSKYMYLEGKFLFSTLATIGFISAYLLLYINIVKIILFKSRSIFKLGG